MAEVSEMSGVELQPLVFLACLGAGVASALLYAVLFLVRSAAKHKRAVELLCDALFVSVAAGSFFLVLYLTNFGQMRLYTVLAFLGGFGILYALLYPLKKKWPEWVEKHRGKDKQHPFWRKGQRKVPKEGVAER